MELGFGPQGVLRPKTLTLRDAVPVAAYPSLDYGYGLGYQALRWGDTVAMGHSGNLAGYTSMLLYDSERGFGVIVLRSAAGGKADAGRLAGRVFRSLRLPSRSRNAASEAGAALRTGCRTSPFGCQGAIEAS
jgi:CubicO group peptidase (beta-lactamase class C family)